MIERTLQNLPNSAGVYKFYNENKKLLYIGKAKVLKNRVRSYFKFTPKLGPSNNLSQRIAKMINEARQLEFILAASEYDALILENALIKELKPKYNILLRDDKTYPYIMLDLNEKFPRFEITRTIKKKKHIKYFGPFSTSATDIINALYITHKLVQKKACLKEAKACLFFQIDRCHAPCVGKINEIEYKNIINEAEACLIDRKKLITKLNKKMQLASDMFNFEEAAKLRDLQTSIKRSLHIIHLDLAKIESFDLFCIEIVGNIASIVKLFIRDGKVVSSIHNNIKNSHGYDKGELYKRILMQFYNASEKIMNKEVLVADEFEESEDVISYIKNKYNKNIKINVPKRGEKLELIKIAKKNAVELLNSYLNTNKNNTNEELKELFGLQKIPQRIEIFDNSHLGGDAPVGCMVIYDDKFIKSAYRVFNLNYHDEYHQMEELLQRRINHFKDYSPPDLWILDGGSTLLKLAEKLLKDNEQQIDILAIAKEKRDSKAQRAKIRANDIIYTTKYDFKLPTSDKRLQFVQRLRDEAHRFAITTHRKRKLHDDLKIDLLNIKGIGDITIKKLLSYFGTFENVYSAKRDELANVIGKKQGTLLFDFINK